jgi:hypothetical protein
MAETGFCQLLQEIRELADIVDHLLSSHHVLPQWRVSSSFGIIHTKLHNHLGVERAAKLVFCYHMLHGKSADD